MYNMYYIYVYGVRCIPDRVRRLAPPIYARTLYIIIIYVPYYYIHIHTHVDTQTYTHASFYAYILFPAVLAGTTIWC